MKKYETDQLSFTDSVTGDGCITGKKIGVFAHLFAEAPTTITVAGTYYPIAGSFTNSPIEGFTAATVHTPGIKYTEALTQYFEIDWHATLESTGNGVTVQLGIMKNGTIIPGSIMGLYCKTGGELYTASGTCVVELATNDEIQLVVTADNSTEVLSFSYYTTTINEFFD